METKRMPKILLGLAVLYIAAAISCGRTRETPPKNEQTKPSAMAGLAQLSDADREIAERQKVCPVSGELLGKHGKPTKITVKGQVVFLCCPGCEEAITKDPDKYLAKLRAAGSK